MPDNQPMDTPLAERSPGDLLVVTRRAVESNYFYFVSAALMLLGSYLLMPDKQFLGEPFWPTVRSLLTLQGYEVLVIATAAIIVRRLRALDDAFMLLLIEITLILDPTFFSNSFGTMPGPSGTVVNVICLALVPAKLAVLQATLRLRVSARGWAAFLCAALFVYLAEGPMARANPPRWIGRDGYLYLLSWAPAAFVCLVPAPRGFIASVGEREDHIAPSRLRILRATLLALPVLVMFAHVVESSFVHELGFHLAHTAPLVLALAVGYVRWVDVTKPDGNLVVLDVVIFAALLLASPWANLGNDRMQSVRAVTGQELPAFLRHHVPAALTALSAIALYGFYYARTRSRAALWHIAAIVGAGAAWGLWQIEFLHLFAQGCGHAVLSALRWFGRVLGWAGGAIGACFRWVGGVLAVPFRWLWRFVDPYWRQTPRLWHWIGDHVSLALLVPWCILVGVAIWRRGFWTVLAVVELGVWLVFGLAPGGRGAWVPEWFQVTLVFALVFHHVFRDDDPAKMRGVLAFVVVCFAIGRWQITSEPLWPLLVVAVHALAFCIAGVRAREARYLGVSIVAMGAVAVGVMRRYSITLSASSVVIGGALAAFAVGVAITFNKQRVLQAYDRFFAVAPPASEPAPAPLETPVVAETTAKALVAPEEEGADAPPEVPAPDKSLEMGRYIEALVLSQPEHDIFLARDEAPEIIEQWGSQVKTVPGERIVAFVGGVDLSQVLLGGRSWRLLLTTERLVRGGGLLRKSYSILYSQIASVATDAGMPAALRLTGHTGSRVRIDDLSGYQAGYLRAVLHRLTSKTWHDFAQESARKAETREKDAFSQEGP